MADDVELDIGFKIDETQFPSSFNGFLSTLQTATAKALQDAVDSVKGPAAKNWGVLPYQTFHTQKGAAYAAQAFVPGFASDLKDLGIKKNTQFYEASLLSAAYKSSVPDAAHRAMLLQSYGQNAPTPDSVIERVLSTDYELLSQPWSRAFIKQGKNGSLKANFAKMRDYAVEQGVGEWIDPEQKHTADNFQFIDKELEKIDEKAEKSKNHFNGWGLELKGVLGTLTAIGGTIAKVGGAVVGGVVAANRASEREVFRDAGRVDARRAFVNMSVLDQLQAKVASRSVGLGEDAIYGEILSMSDAIQQYKLLGQGDALPPALLGIFDNLMSSDNPYDTYKGAADEIYEKLKTMSSSDRQQTLMLMDKAGLGSMSHLVGQFLSNPEYADKYGAPSQLFSLQSNPYYSYYNQAGGMVPDLTKLNESIRASYLKMATDWQESFGEPFKSWWDDLLKGTIAPWAEKLEKVLGKTVRTALGKQTDEDEAKNNVNAIRDLFVSFGGDAARLAAMEANSGKLAIAMQGGGEYAYSRGSTWSDFVSGKGLWRNRAFTQSNLAGMVPQAGKAIDFSKASVGNAYWNDFVSLASYTDEERQGIHAVDQESLTRITKMVNRLKETKLADFLNNNTYEDMDKYLIRGITMGLYDADDWEANFEAMINTALLTSLKASTDEEVVKLLRTIADNTAVADIMYNDPELMAMFRNRYPEFYAERMREQLHFGNGSSAQR